MTYNNSRIRLDIPSAPSIVKSPASFNEVLQTYGSLRSLQSAISSIFDYDAQTQAELAEADAAGKQLLTNLSRMLVPAGADITAGRFLELYFSSGWKVRHTDITASFLYSSVIGLALEDCKAGKVAEIFTAPTVIPGFSGLTPGKVYYAYLSGQFTDISGVVRPGGSGVVDLIPCGTALTATKMKLFTAL